MFGLFVVKLISMESKCSPVCIQIQLQPRSECMSSPRMGVHGQLNKNQTNRYIIDMSFNAICNSNIGETKEN